MSRCELKIDHAIRFRRPSTTLLKNFMFCIRIKYQRGAAILLLMLFLLIGIGIAFTTAMPPDIGEEHKQLITQQALEAAKEALLAYAAGDNERPGELPCPDIDNDGKITSADGVTGNCASLRGWLPWFLLGLGDLRDGSGEKLWYVLSDPFRPYGSVPPGLPLNSDTQTDLVIYGVDPDNPNVAYNFPHIAAIIIAPGDPLPNNESNRTSEKLTDGSADDVVASYLEKRNRDTDKSTYTKESHNDNFNDVLMIITVDQVMKYVESRVKTTVINQIKRYYIDKEFYPYAVGLPGESCDGSSVQTAGYLPFISEAGCTHEVFVFPQWFGENDWNRMFWYAFDPSCQTNGGSAAPACAGTMTVDENSNIESLILFSGKAIDGSQNRPSDLPADYFDDNENYDLDSLFQYPVSSDTNNDELIIIN